MDLVITTILKASPKIEEEAAELAHILAVPRVDRTNRSLAAIRKEFSAANVMIVTKNGPVVNTPGGEYFFHLSMAELRIKNINNGKHDHMLAAMNLMPGMQILDCTVGLATDAIVASYVVGMSGSIIGLESSSVIAAVTSRGLARFVSDDQQITASLRRIQVLHADYNQYLKNLPDKSFDIVYFDPMFRIPINSSSNLKPIRFLADDRSLNKEAVNEACRIARKRVVIKEANGSREFIRLDFPEVLGGKYSSVQYGFITTGG